MAVAMTETELAGFMRTLGPRLLTLARGICRSSDAAEDVVQEAFVKLWKTPPDGPAEVIPSWLRRVVVNLSINHLRRMKRLEAMPEFSLDPALRQVDRVSDRIDTDDRLRRVELAMRQLPVDKQAILVMRLQEQLSYEEIAQALEIPIGTVMSRLNRARAALLELVETTEGASSGAMEGTATIKFPARRVNGA